MKLQWSKQRHFFEETFASENIEIDFMAALHDTDAPKTNTTSARSEEKQILIALWRWLRANMVDIIEFFACFKNVINNQHYRYKCRKVVQTRHGQNYWIAQTGQCHVLANMKMHSATFLFTLDFVGTALLTIFPSMHRMCASINHSKFMDFMAWACAATPSGTLENLCGLCVQRGGEQTRMPLGHCIN